MKNTRFFVLALTISVLAVGLIACSNEDDPGVAPKAPETVSASILDGMVTIAWSGTRGATGYEVYRSNDDFSYFFLRGEVTGTSCTDPFPQSGSNYYKVVALNGKLKSGLSVASSVVTHASSYEFEPDMVFIQGGTFIMGAQNIDGRAANYTPAEVYTSTPTHSVTLSDFAIAKCEITLRQWYDVMGEWPEHVTFDSDANLEWPICLITWNECEAFIAKLNQLTGKKYRLPTEAEWEFSARGGNASKGYQYSGGDALDSIAWHTGNADNHIQPVGLKKPNELGLFDMTGNVSEFCSDWYGTYSSDSQTNPTGPFFGTYRLRRGGHIRSQSDFLYVFSRLRIVAHDYDFLGIRVALSVPD